MSQPVRVLCVDDSRDLAELICMLIERTPGLCSVGAIHSADDLEGEINSRQADVALLDLTMPGVCPLDALRSLMASNPRCRVVVMSGHDDHVTVERAFEAGAWGFVSKCGDPNDIISAVQVVIDGGSPFPGGTRAPAAPGSRPVA